MNLETPMQSVVIARASSGTGDGGETIKGATPSNRADVIVTVLTPVWVIFIRAAKAYFDTFVGVIAAGGLLGTTTSLLPVSDVASLFQGAALLSIGAAAASVVRNLAELFSKLDQKWPSFTV